MHVLYIITFTSRPHISSAKLHLIKGNLEGENQSIYAKSDREPFAPPCKTIHLPKHPKSKCKLHEGRNFCLFCLLAVSPAPGTIPEHS